MTETRVSTVQIPVPDSAHAAVEQVLAGLPEGSRPDAATVDSILTAAITATVHEIQARAEGAGVSAARSHGWCDVFGRLMGNIFPWGALDEDNWRDDTGRDCNGNRWHDADGYDRQGFDYDGYDRDGFDADGLDRDGFNRGGLDRDGIHRDAPERFRFDSHGYDVEGFHRETGYAVRNLTRERQVKRREHPEWFVYDRNSNLAPGKVHTDGDYYDY